MIGEFVIFGVLMYLIFAIIILWSTSLIILEKRRIDFFLPFLLVSISFVFYASFVFYGIFDGVLWTILEALSSIALLWIIINLWRENDSFN
jgi:hypothetical protein